MTILGAIAASWSRGAMVPPHGTAEQIVTEKNMRQAYGVGVKIVEFVDANNQIMRMCAPNV